MPSERPHVIRVIDSHTGGEPTRLVVAGGPELGDGPLEERLGRFREAHVTAQSALRLDPEDPFRRGIVSD